MPDGNVICVIWGTLIWLFWSEVNLIKWRRNSRNLTCYVIPACDTPSSLVFSSWLLEGNWQKLKSLLCLYSTSQYHISWHAIRLANGISPANRIAVWANEGITWWRVEVWPTLPPKQMYLSLQATRWVTTLWCRRRMHARTIEFQLMVSFWNFVIEMAIKFGHLK